MGRRGAWPPLRSVPLPGAVGSGGPGRSSTRGSSSGGGRGLAVAGVSASGGAFCGQRWSGRRAWSRGEPVKRLRKTRLLSPSSRLRGAPSPPGSPSRSRVAAAALPSPPAFPSGRDPEGVPAASAGCSPAQCCPLRAAGGVARRCGRSRLPAGSGRRAARPGGGIRRPPGHPAPKKQRRSLSETGQVSAEGQHRVCVGGLDA